MAKRSKPADPRTKLFKAAFDAIARNGWRDLRIADVARSAGLTVAEAYRIAPDRASLMDTYVDEIDARVAEQMIVEPGDGGSWRDLAFDGLMMRFDAMLRDRDALRVVYFDDRSDVVALARSARRTRRSLERVLELAGFSDDSFGRRLGAIVLVPLYARVFRTWLNDEADQARTMADLDKALMRLEHLADRFTRRGVAPRTNAEQPEDEFHEPPATNGSTH
jgi:AcrR family transcriptional regulator